MALFAGSRQTAAGAKECLDGPSEIIRRRGGMQFPVPAAFASMWLNRLVVGETRGKGRGTDDPPNPVPKGGTRMTEDLEKRVMGWLGERVDAFGFAPVERFEGAPGEHHPGRICRDAATVIVYGVAVPRAVFTSPAYALHLLQRSYHTSYSYLDQVGLALSRLLEELGHPAVVIPAYAPLVFHGLEPWGLLSLKHAAVQAGLGSFGTSGMVYHPRFGSLLRLGAVVTAAPLPGNPKREVEPCPPGCNACREICPSGAYAEGSFQKMVCLGHSIKHGIYRHVLTDDYGRENLEMVINTTGYNYWIDCTECQRVCPLNDEGMSIGE